MVIIVVGIVIPGRGGCEIAQVIVMAGSLTTADDEDDVVAEEGVKGALRATRKMKVD